MTASVHSINAADRVNPGTLHISVQDHRGKVAKRIESINAEKMRNADEERSLLEKLDALRASTDRLNGEMDELVSIDDALSDQERALEKLLMRRSGK